MSDIEKIQLFENKRIRTVWNEQEEKRFFSVLDVIEVLTDSKDPTDYFKKMRKREAGLAEYVGTNCPQVEMLTPTGKHRKTLAGEMETVLRIIESVPSKKAEPFKRWMAQVAAERINQAIDPERSIDQAVADYRRLGYSEAWITRRIKTIEIRKGLTDEWTRGVVTKDVDFAFLTDLMSKTWSGLTTREYKKYKGLTNVAKEGAEVAKATRKEVEKRLGHSVVSREIAIDYIKSPEEPPFPEEQKGENQ